MRRVVATARGAGQTIGFVPTMGALHRGHGALIEAAAARTGFVIVSVFVNPTQFGPNEDFAKYPRTLDADVALSQAAGAQCVFAPTAAEMYPQEARTVVHVNELGQTLCGPSRPGHFDGVCTVVLKLFAIVQPDRAVFGAKDAQQARILRRMTRDLNLPLELDIEPTVREVDGLALSSRNRYLSPTERAAAPRIYRALQGVERAVTAGERRVAILEAELREQLQAMPGSRVDYASIVDEDTLQPIETIHAPALAAVAVFVGSTRLIDNMVLAAPSS
ncbi:MAG: pantoate--beta-alanine ligase [Gemmataceae bacterium]